MDQYLTNFINFLKEKLGDDLAGVVIYGSYVTGNFDPEKSDYDVFVLFKDEVIDIKSELNEKFPRISLQLYMNIKELEDKIINGGWNTYIAFIYAGKVLYSTTELEDLRQRLSEWNPDIKDLNPEQRIKFIEKLKADTSVANQREGYDLNKFLLHSLLRKLQVLHFIKTNQIILDFNELLKLTDEEFITENYSWLKDIEKHVFERRTELFNTKENYIKVLEEADLAIERAIS